MSPAGDVAAVIARALADEPELVTVTEAEHRGTTVVELLVAPGDIGRIIGRQGRTVAVLRTLVAAAGERVGKKVMLDVREAAPEG
jgi:uncharacterized protein